MIFYSVFFIIGEALAVLVQVPGKVMIAGEYAVLWGGHSLAFTVDRSLRVEMASKSGQSEVHSSLWTEPLYVADKNSYRKYPGCELVLDELKRQLEPRGLSGVHLKIDSDINVNDGIGSSSALRLAIALAADALEIGQADYQNMEPDEMERRYWMIGKAVYESQLAYQRFASGYDIATQLAGGVLKFAKSASLWPSEKLVLNELVEALSEYIHIFVGGAGAPTKKVGGSTLKQLEASHKKSEFIDCSEQLISSICQLLLDGGKVHAEQCFHLLEQHRAYFQATSYYPSELDQLLRTSPGYGRDWSFKTTGAGGEDAIIIIGHKELVQPAKETLEAKAWYALDARASTQGAFVEFL